MRSLFPNGLRRRVRRLRFARATRHEQNQLVTHELRSDFILIFQVGALKRHNALYKLVLRRCVARYDGEHKGKNFSCRDRYL